MAKFILKNAKVVVNAVDLSNRVDEVKLEEKFAAVESTAMGDGAKTYTAGGLGDHAFTCDFQQDFGAAEVDATIGAVLNTIVPVVVLTDSTQATSTTNPSWTFSVLINQYTPIGGKVGELDKFSVTWPVSGSVTEHYS